MYSLQLCFPHNVFEYFNFDPGQLFLMLGYEVLLISTKNSIF
jgi:hypothetical protein